MHESGEDEIQNMDFMKHCDKSKCLPAKYTPNPDWLLYKPWGYKFRKARYAQLLNKQYDARSNTGILFRYVYVPEDENSSKSIEIERVMRESRLRELLKGVYSSSYGETMASKVNCQITNDKHFSVSNVCFQMNNIKEYGNSEDVLDSAVRSIDAETIVLQGEAERRKPLSLAEKRKRNETLAIGLSRTELLVSDSKEKTIKGFAFFF